MEGSSTRKCLFGPVATEWKPDDAVPYSGVYRATHGGNHLMISAGNYVLKQDIICLAGQTFPHCHQCGGQPRFTFVAYGDPVEQDEYLGIAVV